MTKHSYQLIAAEADHVRQLMGWFGDHDQIWSWGGPRFRYPFDSTSFNEDLAWQELDSFALVAEENGSMLAFGQFYEKLGRIHLARLAVSPQQRSHGLGGVLIRRLLERGAETIGRAESSLYVAESNIAAQRCYQREGFIRVPLPAGAESLDGAFFMIRPSD